MAHGTDEQTIRSSRPLPRYFLESRQVAWVLLVLTCVWGVASYRAMPQRKDPVIPVLAAMAVTPWPGVSAAEVEQQITRPVEETIGKSSAIRAPAPGESGIVSTSTTGLSVVIFNLEESLKNAQTELNDIDLRLKDLNQRLPRGAGPIQFYGDFGDTYALMLTVASPKVSDIELGVRAKGVTDAIRAARADLRDAAQRVTVLYCFPPSISPESMRRNLEWYMRAAEKDGVARAGRIIEASGFMGIDATSEHANDELVKYVRTLIHTRAPPSAFHPDAWGPAIIRDPAETEAAMRVVAGDKYSYAELDDFTDLIARALVEVPQASTYQRSGVLPEEIRVEYSQERLAGYGLQASRLGEVLEAQNISPTAGAIDVAGKLIYLHPTGEFSSTKDIANVIVGASPSSGPIYLRDVAEVSRGYQRPARFLNYYRWRDKAGTWQRSRAVTVAVTMREGQQIRAFGRAIDEKLQALRTQLPRDLIVARTSDQPRQVRENIGLFMGSLNEAIVLVVVIALLGFWDWRAALLMALSIPVTLALTFGFMAILRLDLQQVSIASLIIALGLLVDNPVVAGDAIKNRMAHHPRAIAAWLGPARLTNAIVYATITNVAAYFPFLLLPGATGDFLYSLPLAMAASLVASLIVALTFVPLLGYYVLRPPRHAAPTIEERRNRGFTGMYRRIAESAIRRRWLVLPASLLFLAAGAASMLSLKTLFFPADVQYWATIDVRLPNDASATATNAKAEEIERAIIALTEEYGRSHPPEHGAPGGLLHSITTFVGGGGPRFWFSVAPEPPQQNYAQLIVEIEDKNSMPDLAGYLQTRLAQQIAGARIDVKQLELNPVEYPIELQIKSTIAVDPARSDEDIATLRQLAGRTLRVLRETPGVFSAHSNWQDEGLVLAMRIDSERANLAGVTNAEVALSAALALNGAPVSSLREGNKQIPVVAVLRPEERAQLSSLNNLYVQSFVTPHRIPIAQVADLRLDAATQRIVRRDRARTMSVLARPAPGVLASEALQRAMSRLEPIIADAPPGYTITIAGEQAKQQSGFADLARVMAISIAAIFLALVVQFRSGIKPFLVFVAVPYGMVGAIIALAIMRTPFGFMALLGIASLVGVIVSHVIVLFDYIEEMQEAGRPFERAVVDAGISRLRPVMVTVGATILALFPLALHGGPLWQPMCYAQIGGLAVATFITLLLVPVVYSVFVLDLKWIRWETPNDGRPGTMGTE